MSQRAGLNSVLLRSTLLGVFVVASGCWTATTSRVVSSKSPYGRPMALVGARSPDKRAFRVSAQGEGTLVSEDAPADSGMGGRWVPRGYVGATLGVQHGKYFEWGLTGGAYLGQVRTHGNPLELDEPALATLAAEWRTIFGPEDWQISIHLRLGATALAADWDFETVKIDHEKHTETRTIGRAWNSGVGVSCAAGISFTWRFLDRLALFGGLNLDIVPYLERASTATGDCNACAATRGNHFPPLRYGAVPVGFLGLEATLHPNVRARIAVTPAVLQPDASTTAWLSTQATVEFVY